MLYNFYFNSFCVDRLIDVLLVHDGHCNLCNKFAHSLANVFCETGRINCFLDLCLTTKISTFGMKWYEQKFQDCEKIVVICTKESKNTYEDFYGKGNYVLLKRFCYLFKDIYTAFLNENFLMHLF